jgi:hypothetical protein
VIPYAIHTIGARPHQRGYASFSDTGRSYWIPGRATDAENPNGPVKVLVENFKAKNAKGRRLLRKPQ